MKLGDKIKLHIERQPMFADGKPDITDGVFTVIGISYGLPHCFSTDSWSQGFNSFEYGQEEADRPDIVRKGSVYVISPDQLDLQKMDELHYDKKVVSWEIL